MVDLVSPNGVTIRASDEAAPRLIESGFIVPETKGKAEGAAPKRRTAKRQAKKG